VSVDKILIGIDLGSTVLKVAAFNARTGAALGSHSERLRLSVGSDGRREESPRGLNLALGRAMASLRTFLGNRWQDVAGIGLAAQGGSAIIVDKCTGKALTPMMMWNDARANKQAILASGLRSKRFWQARTRRDTPGHGLAKMLWLRKQDARLFSENNLYVGAGEYAYFGLTETWRQDACNALQIGCFNVPKQKLDPSLLEVIDVPLSFVAPLREGHEINPLLKKAARRFDLPEGIPVAGPYMDHEAGYMSACDVSKKPLQCSLGTAWVGNFQIPMAEKWSSASPLVIPAVVDEGWLVIQPLRTGNVAWDWGLRTFLDRDHSKALDRLGEVFDEALLPPSDLLAMPWFNASEDADSIVTGGGTFFGATDRTDSLDRLRALAASMVYEMMRVLTEAKACGKVDSVVLGGGASKGTFFRSLFAALFSPLPVYSLKEEDLSGARGSLRVLNAKVAKAEVRKVRCPGGRIAGEIKDGYGRYLKMFKKLYGDPAGMGAIQFDCQKEKKR